MSTPGNFLKLAVMITKKELQNPFSNPQKDVLWLILSRLFLCIICFIMIMLRGNSFEGMAVILSS